MSGTERPISHICLKSQMVLTPKIQLQMSVTCVSAKGNETLSSSNYMWPLQILISWHNFSPLFSHQSGETNCFARWVEKRGKKVK